MRNTLQTLFALLLLAASPVVFATQADDTTISITSKTPGVTVFISQFTLQASSADFIKSIEFSITPKAGSVTRPLTGTYSQEYMISHGYETPGSETIFLPVYGLYPSYTNTVTLTYNFLDGSSKQATTTVATGAFVEDCGYTTPTVLQARVPDAYLSYDYFFTEGACSVSPVILDTDGEVRWASPLNTTTIRENSSRFYDNAVYLTIDSILYRVELDGTVSSVADYSSLGFVNFHHDIDIGKTGMVLDVDTTDYLESVNIEVDKAGNILKTWNLADIISAAMVAGGDDPSQFVALTPVDWFHNNSTAYRRSDNSLIVSSRENFVMALDYDSQEIKWILGDETKQWFQFPSLAQYALTLTAGGTPPIGEHAVSLTTDNGLLLFDNGRNSEFHTPQGINLPFSLPRKYWLDIPNQQATELAEYPGTQEEFSDFCGSVYEDAKQNYLTDYAFISNGTIAQILGFNADGVEVFGYQYPGNFCSTAYNSFPIHLESTKFPAVGPQALNISTRAMVGEGENFLIAGFIVTGSTPKTVVLRALGASLSDSGVANPLADPVMQVYNSAGEIIATNDNWQDDPGADTIVGDQLAPADPLESATLQTLDPGSYTVVIHGQNLTSGVSLVEVYDLSPLSGSILANLSTRGFVGTGEEALISGFIVGDVDTTTVVVRGLGPSLTGTVAGPLGNPTLTVFDSTGTAVATNDDWQDGMNAADITALRLAPGDSSESALLLNLRAGSYTGVLTDADGGTGIGLVEVYNLQPMRAATPPSAAK